MKKKLGIILTSIMLTVSFDNSAYSDTISDLNKEKTEIQNQIQDSKQEIEKSQNEKQSVLEQVNALDADLRIIEEELFSLESSLAKTKESLAVAEKELAEATEKKENQYEALKERIRVMYEYGDSGYLEILLNAEGFTDFLKRVEYVGYIMEYDDEIFKKYEETENFIALKVEQIEIEKQNLEILTEETAAKKAEVEKSIDEKSKIVQQINQQIDTLEQMLEDLEQQDKEITRIINNSRVTATGSSSNKVYSSTGGQLEYPVPAYAGWAYNDVYGYRTSPISGKSELHSGLDLKATYGTDIVAAESGTVIYASNMNGYGYTVMIDHGNGMTTLYAHNSSLVVSVGQQVQRGQVVAKAGSTGYSTGVHCHFEVRINGKTTDPAPYLK